MVFIRDDAVSLVLLKPERDLPEHVGLFCSVSYPDSPVSELSGLHVEKEAPMAKPGGPERLPLLSEVLPPRSGSKEPHYSPHHPLSS